MEECFSLIKCLTKGEWQSLHNYLTCFSSHDSNEIKQVQLAQLLWNADKCPDAAFCCIKIYGKRRDTRFDVLKTRLKEKILDFLLTDISADKQKELDEVDLNIIKLTKKSAQFRQLYYAKKRIPLAYGLLDEIISLAKKYELYSIVVEHLKYKKSLDGFKMHKTRFAKINMEMEKYWEYNRIVNKAEHSYYELILLSEYSGKPENAKLASFFEKRIVEMEGYYQNTKSPLIKYLQKFLELGYHQHHNNYLQARSTCLELLNIVRNNKSVYRRQRLGIVHDNLSRCEFYLGNFTQAAENAREAQQVFNQNSENFCIALEQEFYALFALKQYEQSMDIANKMIASATPEELGLFRYSKYNYLLANAFFKLGKFQEACQLLSNKRGLAADKAGWETGARVLSIMTFIEMLKLNEASSAIGSLRKFIDYTNKKTPVSLRDKTILNLLIGAERKGFMFSLLNGKTEDYLATLKSSDEKTRWEPFTHELIPFHEWFSGKMGRKMPASKGSFVLPATSNTLAKEKVVPR